MSLPATLTFQHLVATWDTSPGSIIGGALLVWVAALYATAASRRSPRGNNWPSARTAWFVAGIALMIVVYGSGLQVYEDNPAVHVVDHMLVMMAVPPLVLLGAPLTLLLRTLPVRGRRSVVEFFKDPAFRPISGRFGPLVLCADYYLTMYVYQLTPLRTYAEAHPVVHFAVHQYFLLCGLFFWLPIIAIDPVRLRLTRRVKDAMIAAGVPAFGLLGAITLAQGRTSTGWSYIASGVVLTVAGLALVAWRGSDSRALVSKRRLAGAVELDSPAQRVAGEQLSDRARV